MTTTLQHAGDATELLTAFEEIRHHPSRPDGAFLAYLAPNNRAEWNAIVDDLCKHLYQWEPKFVVLAMEGNSRPSFIRKCLHALATHASKFSSIQLGRDVSIVGIAMTDDRLRNRVASRVVEHLNRPSVLGDRAVFNDTDVAQDSILDLIVESDL